MVYKHLLGSSLSTLKCYLRHFQPVGAIVGKKKTKGNAPVLFVWAKRTMVDRGAYLLRRFERHNTKELSDNKAL